jgi:glycosyltransferase involved in cell wall biosynthesis
LLKEDEYDITLVGLTANQIKQLPKGIKGIERTQSVNELAKLYATSDLFVNPTYCDTFPTVNIEALACGTPVITYNVGGSPEIIDEETGWVVNKGDVEAIVQCIKNVANESAEETEYRKSKCCERAVMYYNKEDRYQDYIELYKELLNEK